MKMTYPTMKDICGKMSSRKMSIRCYNVIFSLYEKKREKENPFFNWQAYRWEWPLKQQRLSEQFEKDFERLTLDKAIEDLTEKMLMNARNFGKKTLVDMKVLLAEYGLRLTPYNVEAEIVEFQRLVRDIAEEKNLSEQEVLDILEVFGLVKR